MQDDHQQRRFGDATELQESIEALAKVPVDKRRGFLHDRLMSHIDGVCRHHGTGGKNCFTGAQILAIKDISFLIIDILDPKSKKSKGFFPALWIEFKEKSPLGQLTAVGAVIAFFVTLIVGTATVYEKVIRPHALASIENSTSKEVGDKRASDLQNLQINRNPAPMPLLQVPGR